MVELLPSKAWRVLYVDIISTSLFGLRVLYEDITSTRRSGLLESVVCGHHIYKSVWSPGECCMWTSHLQDGLVSWRVLYVDIISTSLFRLRVLHENITSTSRSGLLESIVCGHHIYKFVSSESAV